MKVRLKPVEQIRAIYNYTFQFHEGPIKTRLGLSERSLRQGFNSMKVRLKHERAKQAGPDEAPFQFHEGPIKTLWREDRDCQEDVSIP